MVTWTGKKRPKRVLFTIQLHEKACKTVRLGMNENEAILMPHLLKYSRKHCHLTTLPPRRQGCFFGHTLAYPALVNPAIMRI